jgi:ankyrin repeat domain-containing protein 11/12
LYGNATRLSINQDIPFSYCSLLKDNEVYNNSSNQERTSSFINNDYTSTELGKRGKHRWNGRSFIKWLEDSNLKYKRLSVNIVFISYRFLFCLIFSVK